jgi:hypothetical protein
MPISVIDLLISGSCTVARAVITASLVKDTVLIKPFYLG